MIVLVRNNNGEVIFDNLLDENCRVCEEQCDFEGKVTQCMLNPNEEIRCGKMANNEFIYFLCADKSFAKTTSLFKEKINLLINTTKSFIKLHHDTQQREQERYEKIVHNLRTINGKSVQEMFNYISQETLSSNNGKQLETITKIIQDHPRQAAILFLRMFKYNADIRTEFTAHEKVLVENLALTLTPYNIRRVILNVYHSFYLGFRDKSLDFNITESNKRIHIDYEIIRLEIYHMFNNALKYMQTKTALNVEFIDRGEGFVISFKMQSIYIEEDERESIFDDNYSGKKVIEANKQGKGLGMGLIRKALKLNNAEIEVIAGNDIAKNFLCN